MIFFEKIKAHWVFFILASFFLLEFNQSSPPLQVPDEINHYYRVFQVSEGQLMPYNENNRLGGNIPESVRRFVHAYNKMATNVKYVLSDSVTEQTNNIVYSDERRQFVDFPNTALYSFISYAPQAFGLYMARQMNFKLGEQYYFSRLFICLFWLIAITISIKIIPFGKWILTFVGLLPMHLYITCSMSADTVTNAVSILFISYTLFLVYSKNSIGKKEIALLALLIFLLSQAKLVYIGLSLLLLLLPKQKFASTRKSVFVKGSLLLIAGLFGLIWSEIIMSYYTPYLMYNPEYRDYICLSSCVNYYLQKDIVFGSSTYFFNLIYRSIFEHPTTYLQGIIALFGN
ncbi:MAG: DUF2142 domain-containing protein, partial [Bacteroidia bacterium]